MRFLVDECTGPTVAEWLRVNNHEVFSVFDDAAGMSDEDGLDKAFIEEWILITIDSRICSRMERPRERYSLLPKSH